MCAVLSVVIQSFFLPVSSSSRGGRESPVCQPAFSPSSLSVTEACKFPIYVGAVSKCTRIARASTASTRLLFALRRRENLGEAVLCKSPLCTVQTAAAALRFLAFVRLPTAASSCRALSTSAASLVSLRLPFAFRSGACVWRSRRGYGNVIDCRAIARARRRADRAAR